MLRMTGRLLRGQRRRRLRRLEQAVDHMSQCRRPRPTVVRTMQSQSVRRLRGLQRIAVDLMTRDSRCPRRLRLLQLRMNVGLRPKSHHNHLFR
ncbi:hypothetical protein A5695_14490 [Mycobacterium sp. E1747]|nr:hypothetical protein A5695_14490 [Mycobacterium sp. E1747]